MDYIIYLYLKYYKYILYGIAVFIAILSYMSNDLQLVILGLFLFIFTRFMPRYVFVQDLENSRIKFSRELLSMKKIYATVMNDIIIFVGTDMADKSIVLLLFGSAMNEEGIYMYTGSDWEFLGDDPEATALILNVADAQINGKRPDYAERTKDHAVFVFNYDKK